MMMLRSRSTIFFLAVVLLLVICQHDRRPSFSLGFVVERRRSVGNPLPAEARHCGAVRVQQRRQRRQYYYPSFWGSSSSSSPSHYCRRLLATKDDDDDNTNDEGADLAAEFFKVAHEKGIDLEASTSELEGEGEEDEEEEEEDEDDDEEDDEEVNYPQGAINAFLGYDTGEVGDKLAGNVSLTDDQLYSEVKERVLDTAGGFVDYVKAAKGDDDDDAEEDADDDEKKKPKVYEPPETVPDPELTAGEVVILVLDALSHNDVPTVNRGVEILFGYSSPGSQIKNEQGLTPAEYAEFLKETEYKVLFDHTGASIDKADYSFDGKKAFFTARLNSGGPKPTDTVSVNFILSTTGVADDSCWLVDSLLIRPQSMRRRRRR